MPKKAVKLADEELCKKWNDNKNVNPETSRKIKETGAVYKKLAKKCLDDKKEIIKKTKMKWTGLAIMMGALQILICI